MKTINKSGNEERSTENSFYVLLSPEANDVWANDVFRCNTVDKYLTEEEAVEDASPGEVIAKVTLVAKIV